MDYHRRHPLLPQVEITAQQSPYRRTAMGVHEAGLILAFHHRVARGKLSVIRGQKKKKLTYNLRFGYSTQWLNHSEWKRTRFPSHPGR